MIEKIEISGSNYKIEDSFHKYAVKRIGKLDKYLPHGSKKDVIAKIVVTEVGRAHGNKYEISAAMEIPGGKVIAAKDECSNIFKFVVIKSRAPHTFVVAFSPAFLAKNLIPNFSLKFPD